MTATLEQVALVIECAAVPRLWWGGENWTDEILSASRFSSRSVAQHVLETDVPAAARRSCRIVPARRVGDADRAAFEAMARERLSAKSKRTRLDVVAEGDLSGVLDTPKI